MNIEDLPNSEGEAKALEATTAFSEKDATEIHPHNDDSIIINVRWDE